MFTLFHWLTQLFRRLITFLEHAFLHLTQPSRHSIVLSIVTDLTRNKANLIAQNALLRQQLIVLHRKSKTPPSRNPIASGSSSLQAAASTGKRRSASSNPTRFSAGIVKDSVSSGSSNRVTVGVVPN
ncbi:MAG: hypothetical protein HZB51_00795 [Chloroflexi bacterium]|nr:hypothetical protein [Chloroflexota bacterium]